MGYDLPFPYGVMVNYVHQTGDLELFDPEIALGNTDFVSIDFVDFRTLENTSNILNVRADAWVFPFLNLYGIYAHSWTKSYIPIRFPVNFDIHTNSKANTVGFGGVLAYGWGDYFMAANLNYSWSFTDALDDPVKATVTSIRFGKIFNLNKLNHNINVSIGIQNQVVDRRSKGSLTIDEIFGLMDPDAFQDLKDQIASDAMNWYDDLSFAQKLVVDKLVNTLDDYFDGKDVGQTPLHYKFNKVPPGTWSAQLGVQYNMGKRLWYRLEYGIGKGRQQLMLSTTYRFGF